MVHLKIFGSSENEYYIEKLLLQQKEKTKGLQAKDYVCA